MIEWRSLIRWKLETHGTLHAIELDLVTTGYIKIIWILILAVIDQSIICSFVYNLIQLQPDSKERAKKKKEKRVVVVTGLSLYY